MEIALIIGIVIYVIFFSNAGLLLFIAWGLFKTRNIPDPPKVKNARPVNYNDKRKIEEEMDWMLADDKRRRRQQQQQMQQQMYQQQMYQQEVDQQMQQQMSMGGFGF